MRLLFIVLGLAFACSPGPGRAPHFPDASVREDAAPQPASDAAPDAAEVPDGADAGAPDSTTLLPDAMVFPPSRFTGVFGIVNSVDSLFAREVKGQLVIVVRGYPYDYVGTVDEAGNVELTSPTLMRLGCLRPFLRGKFDRLGATYQLIHETCNEAGEPISSLISGGFNVDFDPTLSGVYQLNATVDDLSGCFTGPRTGLKVSYSVNYFGGSLIAVVTTGDFVGAPVLYWGSIGDDYALSSQQRVPYLEDTVLIGFTGSFEQPTALDPVRFRGRRTVYDFMNQCSFGVVLDGVRVEAP